jgi:pyruvate dehydrogenase E1 component beta subunit
MPVLNMVQAINLALREEMQRNPDVVVLGEDVGKDGGVFRVTEGLLDKFGQERVMDTPLAESGIAGVSIGMAAFGLRPVAEIQFMGFIYPALDQLFCHASRLRSRSHGRYTCPVVIRTPYGGGIKAIELHSESSEALFCHMPGLKVVVPSGPYNAKGLLTSCLREPDPVVFLEPTRLYRMIKEEVPEGEYTIPLSKARKVKEGKDLTIVAWGSMLQKTLKAADPYSADIIDPMTLCPLDEEAIIGSVKKTGRLLIVHEAPKNCGLGAEISATIAEEAMLYLRAPVMRVCSYDVVLPFPRFEDYYLPDAARITKKIEEILRY